MSSKGVLVFVLCTLVVATLAQLPLYQLGKKSYYLDIKNTKNWFESYQFCRKIGLQLLTLDSECEFQVLRSFLKNENVSGNVWTSGTNFNDGWRWMSTGLPIRYKNWDEKAQKNATEEQMVELRTENEFKMAPASLADVNNFVCEEPKNGCSNSECNSCSA